MADTRTTISAVASTREVEKYRREREDAIKPKIAVTAKQAKSFNTFVPDFDQLASFERKVEKKADQLDARQNGLAVEETVNVMGSTAGAGSGDFHMYRGHRAVELQRLADFESARKQEQAQAEWEEERDARAAAQEAKSSKKADKRAAKKARKRAADDAEREAKAARRAEAEVAAPAAAGAADAAPPAT